MTARLGRQVQLLWGNGSPQQPIEGLREKGVTFGGDAIDVTSDEDGGFRTLIENTVGQRELNITLSGVSKSPILRRARAAGQTSANATLIYPNGDTITGLFELVKYEETDKYNDAATFTAEIQSNGEYVYTPASP
jgi:predicted secreted protein